MGHICELNPKKIQSWSHSEYPKVGNVRAKQNETPQKYTSEILARGERTSKIKFKKKLEQKTLYNAVGTSNHFLLFFKTASESVKAKCQWRVSGSPSLSYSLCYLRTAKMTRYCTNSSSLSAIIFSMKFCVRLNNKKVYKNPK